MEVLRNSHGLVVVKKALSAKYIELAGVAFASLVAKEEVEDGYRHFVLTDNSEPDAFKPIASKIAEVLSISRSIEPVFRYALSYRPGEGIHPHRDRNDDGGIRVAFCIKGVGEFFTSMDGHPIESTTTEPGDLIVQNLGIGVEHGVEPVKRERVAMVWDFEL